MQTALHSEHGDPKTTVWRHLSPETQPQLWTDWESESVKAAESAPVICV